MTHSAKTIGRRELLGRGAKVAALALVGAAVTAIPAVGLSMSLKGGATEDKLLGIIRRYEAEVAALNARGDLSDEETDAWIDHASEILTELDGVPALTAASALAALNLVVEEEDIGEHSIYGDHFLELVDAVRDYIKSTAA